MKARAAGEAVRWRRQTSATGSSTTGSRLRTSTAGPSSAVSDRAAPERRSTGIGRALLDFAESDSRARGRTSMQLELLVPREWRHPSKVFLKDWYGRRGYRLVRTGTIDETHPQLAPLLATPCDLEVHRKPLRPSG
jgi:hypothetical protein